MQKDEIIRLAREANLPACHASHPVALGRFAALVAAAEREACAKVCDVTPPYPFRPSIEAAHAIRARGQQ